MTDRSAEAAEIVEQHGSFLLVRRGSHFAIVERRAGRVYPAAPGERTGEPMTAEGITAAAAELGWLPENEARRLFHQLCEEGDRLARSLR